MKELLAGLYDLMTWITCHYSEMPTSFQSRFSETSCGEIRRGLFNALFVHEDDEK